MSKTNSSTESAKKEMEGMKHDVENLVQRLSNIKDKSGDIMTEQLDSLAGVLSELRNKGESKGKDILREVSNSTLEHPVRNLTYAFGVGFVLALLIK